MNSGTDALIVRTWGSEKAEADPEDLERWNGAEERGARGTRPPEVASQPRLGPVIPPESVTAPVAPRAMRPLPDSFEGVGSLRGQ
jgi:hypothetical protein